MNRGGEPAVEAIEVDRDSHVTVRFDDGVTGRVGIAELRLACPCATCIGRRQRGESVSPAVDGGDVVTITDARLEGAFGISLDWSDGHRTGIHAWTTLRTGLDDGTLGVVVDQV